MFTLATVVSSPSPLSLSSQQGSHFERLIEVPAREKVHMYCLILECHSDKATVVSQVCSLPESKQRTKLVEPSLVELSG